MSRLCPPVSKLILIIRSIEDTLGVKHADNGKIAFTGIVEVLADILRRDCGNYGMPELTAYLGGAIKLPVVVQFDGTGFGHLSINTAVIRNPHLPQTSQKLRPIGVGKCKDDKCGTVRLLADNLPIINGWIGNEHAGVCSSFDVGGEDVEVMPEVFCSTDVAALRHCEHLAKSGWCGCDADFALRMTPSKPSSPAEMRTLNRKCFSHNRIQRFVLSHNPPPGKSVPDKCTAPGCKFAHNRNTADQEYQNLLAEEALCSLATRRRPAGRDSQSGAWCTLTVISTFNLVSTASR